MRLVVSICLALFMFACSGTDKKVNAPTTADAPAPTDSSDEPTDTDADPTDVDGTPIDEEDPCPASPACGDE